MMKYPLVSALALAIAFYGCCTKKKCLGDEIPVIYIKFNNLPQNNNVVVYTFENGLIKDSTDHYLYPGSPLLMLYPYDGFDSSGNISYLLKWNDKQAGISEISCNFKDKELKCNTCFPFGKGTEKVTIVEDFMYHSGGAAYAKGDTLRLNW